MQALHQGSTWLEVRLARVKPPVTDADVGQLVPLAPTLWGLNASGTPLTDTAASTLARLVALRTLRLDHTAITNATVVALSPLGHLEVLNLFGTAVDDQSLAAIEGMASLRAVYLGRTNITLEGLAGLREARPDLAVHGDAALAAPAPEATEDG